MTSLTHYDPFFIGFDDILSRLNSKPTIFPPYNLLRVSDNEYVIELAVAGYSKEDISIVVSNGILEISGNIKAYQDKQYVHKGITSKSFSRSFSVAESVEVTKAAYENGILTLSLTNRIPEAKKVKTITIT